MEELRPISLAKAIVNRLQLVLPEGTDHSYCWRSILKGVELLKCGCHFGSGGDISWKHSGTGQYDVGSGYAVAKLAHMSKMGDAGQCSNSKPLIKFWNTFWKLSLNCLEKSKKFGWRCYHNSLAVGANLYIRHLRVPPACPLCGFAMETADHVFLKCWWATEVWNGVQIPDWDVIGTCVNMADFIFYFL
ncbi:hypothetical protein QQ045_003506 [Rhodiola kirilowii]